MEKQKTLNSQSNPEKEKTEPEESGSLTSNFTILQSFNHQNSMVLAQKLR